MISQGLWYCRALSIFCITEVQQEPGTRNHRALSKLGPIAWDLSLLFSWWELDALFNWCKGILLKEWWIPSFPACTYPELLLSQQVSSEWCNTSHHEQHTARARVWSPNHQKLIFSLARNCKNKPALDDPVQESLTASKERPTAPPTQNHIKLKS